MIILILAIVALCIVYDWKNSQYVSRNVNIAYGVSILFLAIIGLGIIAFALMIVSVIHTYLAKQKAIKARNDQDWERK